MRSNRTYSLREHFSAIRKFLITKTSLLFLRVFPNTELIVVRDGGLGDAIMAVTLLEELKKKYPKTRIYLNANYPELFEKTRFKKHSFFSFPIVWFSYTHYDFFPWTLRKPLHCSSIMADLAGIKNGFSQIPKLYLDEDRHVEFMKNFIHDKKYILIQPNAGDWFAPKNWIPDRWEELVLRLRKRNILVYQIGTLGNSLIQGTIDLRGKTTVEQSILLVKSAFALIGVNSFAEQAAWVFKVPSIILYGPTNPVYSLNPGQIAVYSNYIKKYEELSDSKYSFSEMESIHVETVLEAFNQIEKE